jgi:hypothetical protein
LRATTHGLRRQSLALGATALALALPGCGGSSDAGGANPNSDPASIAPATSAVFVTLEVRPEGDLRRRSERIARRLLRTPDPASRIGELLGPRGAEIREWVGRRAAVVFTGISAGEPQGALILSMRDRKAARASLDKRTKDAESKDYKGVSYRVGAHGVASAIVGDFAIRGDEYVLRQLIDVDKGAPALAAEPRFSKAADSGRGKLGFGYVDVGRVISGIADIGGAGAIAQLGVGRIASALEPVTFTLDPTPDGLLLEAKAKGPVTRASAPQSALLGALPADVAAAAAVPDVGPAIRQALRQVQGIAAPVIEAFLERLRARTGLDVTRDLLPAIGDVALFARGRDVGSLAAGAVISTPDRAAARRVLAALPDALGSLIEGVEARRASGGAVVITLPRHGRITVRLTGARITITYGNAGSDLLKPAHEPGDAPAFASARRAIGGPLAAFADGAAIRRLVAGAGHGGDFADAFAGLASLAVGVSRSADGATARVLLSAQP